MRNTHRSCFRDSQIVHKVCGEIHKMSKEVANTPNGNAGVAAYYGPFLGSHVSERSDFIGHFQYQNISEGKRIRSVRKGDEVAARS